MENKNRKIIISILILLMMLSAGCAGRLYDGFRSSDRFGETVAIGAEEYKALPGNEKSKYGMITVINGVESFWDETVALLGESD